MHYATSMRYEMQTLLGAAILVAASGFAGAQPPLRDLPKPAVELSDPFSSVSAAAELRPGVLVVFDAADGELSVVDVVRGRRSPLGRQGSGPGEYRTPAGIFTIHGDTLWVLDATQMRIVVFGPDLKPGSTFPFMMFDTQTGTALTSPIFADSSGKIYASAMPIEVARGGANTAMKFPDSVSVVRVDPRNPSAKATLARVRFPTSGQPRMEQSGTSLKYTFAYPGLVAADPWAVFPDGRLAIVRGANYTVEFIAADGTRSPAVQVPYEPFSVTEADRKAEMEEARKRLAEQSKQVQRMLPPNVSMTFDMIPPTSWPDKYPPVAPMGAMAAPDGRLWVKRSVPVRIGREMWDVIGRDGRLLARWRLPPKTSLVALGRDAIYAVRTDEDDLRYLQRIVLPR